MQDVSIDFRASASPREFNQRASTQLSHALERRGWKLVRQTEDHLAWERRYWLPAGWIAFAVVFIGGLFVVSNLNSGSQDANSAWLVVIVWAGLLIGCSFVRGDATMYLAISPDGSGTSAHFGGRADRRTISALAELSAVET